MFVTTECNPSSDMFGEFIRQFQEDDNKPADLICMSHKMFKDVLEAMNQTEGFYLTNYTRKT